MKFVGPHIVVDDIAVSKNFYITVLNQKIQDDFGEKVAFTSGLSIYLKSHFTHLVDFNPRDIMFKSNNSELYFEEDDLNGLLNRLQNASSGACIHGIKEQSWGQRVIRFYDPDMHIIEVGESMESVVVRLLGEGLRVEETARRTSMPVEFVLKCLKFNIQGLGTCKAGINFDLREWQPGDAESVAKYANNPKIAQNLRNFFPNPYTLRDAEKYIESCIHANKKEQVMQAIVVHDEVIGSIGVFIKEDVYGKSAEIGYWLGEPFWGQGIMTGAIDQICHFVFNYYDIVRIFAEVFEYNTGSRKALEKAGFQLEGILKKSICKNGRIFDSYLYALTI